MESNPLIERLPKHLKQFIKPQNYELYSAVDQCVWKYVMRKNVEFLSQHAHESYNLGLEKTGITQERIPSMYGMNRILKHIGWAAVAVDGFIPPNAFMEFQAYKILVIAADIRQVENIHYTPSPDIIHEASGHAPMIANADYAEYLRRMGAIGAKAILSAYDIELYEAVRELSILKEAKGVDPTAILEAEARVNDLQAMDPPPSEMAKIRNLQWWTVEYGLIGTLENPKIYGAGLLSSIAESKACLQASVPKLPYTIEACHQNFDITKQQPQYFVTPDFAHLMTVLEDFADTLSLRKGGVSGLDKLIESKRVGTIELSTGLQISGKFTQRILDSDGKVSFFKTEGPSALAFREKELIGHGIEDYPNGFCSALGNLKHAHIPIENMGPYDLKAYNFYDGQWLSFEFASGIRVEGQNVTGIRDVRGKLLLIRLVNCTVKQGDQILFHPDEGIFDLAIGTDIVSAFAGAADPDSFPNLYGVPSTTTIRKKQERKYLVRDALYLRSKSQVNEELFEEAKKIAPAEWLLFLEMLENCKDQNLKTAISAYLDGLPYA